MLLSEALESFLQGELRLRGYSPTTVAHYRRWVTRLALYVAKEEGEIPSVSDISPSHLEKFLTALLSTGLDPGTVRQAGFCFRVFFRWCRKKGFCPEDPAEELVLPKKPQRLPFCPSEEEAKRFIENCADPLAQALVAVAFFTGLRLGELLKLELDDVNIGRGFILVRNGKGGKDRLVPLCENAKRVLRQYIEGARPAVPSKKVFVTKRGTLSLAWATDLIKRERQRQRVRLPITCHSLRHLFATALYERRVGLREIQELLGHSTPRCTAIYTHLSPEALREAVKALDS